MSREILFRGKRKGNNFWIRGDLVRKNNICYIYIAGMPREVEPETVTQYTGLTDGNGVKIFEGDIVRDDDGDVMMVKWLTEGAVFVLEPNPYVSVPYVSVPFYSTLPSRIEVIGNIYDNRELLSE